MMAVAMACMTSLVKAENDKPLSTGVGTKELLTRARRAANGDSGIIECLHMTGTEGEFVHVSAGSDDVCGLYVIGDVNSVVEVQIHDFDIGCQDGGMMAVVDGWELQGELFPSPDDVEGGLHAQYRTYCGRRSPPAVFTASQNAALIQFRVPTPGQGFRATVRFLRNPQPCNILVPIDTSGFTLKNYGYARNCTAHVVFPVTVRLLSSDVRVAPRSGRMRRVPGLSTHCLGTSGPDHVTLMYGLGLDTALMAPRMIFCGRRAYPAPEGVTLGCSNSAVRLESSGVYYNSVTVAVEMPSDVELIDFLTTHPECGL